MRFYKDIQNKLGISSATIHNWIKTGVIPACPKDGYDESDFLLLIDKIKNSEKRLRQGTNRTAKNDLTKSSLIASSVKDRLILKQVLKLKIDFDYSNEEILYVIAIILLQRKNLINLSLRRSKIVIKSSSPVFTKFLKQWVNSCRTDLTDLYRKLLVLDFPVNSVDYLGFVYESIRTLSEKAITGAFFTPSILTDDINIESDLRILDPCSGTGTLLLNSLSKNHNPSSIYLRDIDELALRIAKVNFVLFFNSVENLINTKKSDITDLQSPKGKFDVIISNPPYGAKYSDSKKKSIKKNFPSLKTSESFSIALFQSIKMLKPEGKLYFVLPESLMFVSAHSGIRKEIFSRNKSVYIKYYGKVFKGVMSPIIRLEIRKSGNEHQSEINNKVINFSDVNIRKNDYKPPYVLSQDEIEVLKRIQSIDSFYLKGKIKTGLGIVTGNNSKHLLGLDQDKNRNIAIYTGKELKPFKFTDPRFYIDFKPNKLQQAAKAEQYYSPKICYRFIANRPITLFDDQNNLVLNSINFFEILDERINPRALSAFLNSDIVAFIYRSMFNSTKVLKSHLEAIPIPINYYSNLEKLEQLYFQAKSNEDVMQELNTLCKTMYNL